ncbi:DNA polymerase Y family protein [Xinfangfangia sp. D13-10-4-6]|uniref:Y-family DNA polymerase n=1 Tax=Pseudogemmobacter hezensis TaxID=2737662 RepID=UPI001556991E|nr:DNA polymerase Y family protein [Pseudogemmobacter hezensis]NPD15120.1 DNA polymerase Y family protein [Pseudogemmobacter hezensis]
MARRLLAIWFPRLASDVSLRTRPVEGPFALTHRAGNADELRCLNAAAQAQGLHRGMPLADARALVPDLATRLADPVRETAALVALRRWVVRYAPQVATDGDDGLIADITGVAHLFGGEEDLRGDLQARLIRAGLNAQSAIAGSRGGAHALARHGGGIVPDGLLAERLGHLPVSALRISPEISEGLSRMGLSRIADLIPLPRAPLARRFGAGLVTTLDQMLGTMPEPVGAQPEAPQFGVRMTLPEPIGLTGDVMAGLDRLLERLCGKLASAHMGARRVRLELRRVDKATVTVEVGLARAMRDPERISALFRKGVEEVDSGYGIDALRIEAVVTEPLAPQQIGEAKVRQEDELNDLISRLGNRLGFDHVLRFLPAESRIPERSFLTVPAAYSEATSLPFRKRPRRPAMIFPPEPVTSASGHPPARFRWRRMSFTTLRAAGPERITPEWWLDDPAWRSGVRDYWRIETKEGPRLWLFHTPMAPAWAVQGTFL